MDDIRPFAIVVVAVAGAGMLAVLSSRVTERLRLPAAAVFLAGAAVAEHIIGPLHAPQERTVERLVTVALVVVLFDGGQHLGLARVRRAARPILLVGVVGTFATAAAIAVLTHLICDISWYASLLVGTAVAPTDPAVVFSVLGRREVVGTSGTVLEGESGANDPVGIALMASLLGAHRLDGSSVGDIARTFVEQMTIGTVIGVAAGLGLVWVVRRLALSSESLYVLLVLAATQLVYGVATLAHGSGFLAVFLAGIASGDARMPFRAEIRQFHSALASLGEIVAFVVLGLSVDLDELSRRDVWLPGLVIGLVMALAVRPLVVAACLLRSDLSRRERAFIALVGLKGAVPILLGLLILTSSQAGSARLYGIVVVVVVVSVLGQGGTVPWLTRRLGLATRERPVEPWAFGVRLQDEPRGTYRASVEGGSPADGLPIAQLGDVGLSGWISFIARDGALLAARAETQLRAGDEVFMFVDYPGDDAGPADPTAPFRRS